MAGVKNKKRTRVKRAQLTVLTLPGAPNPLRTGGHVCADEQTEALWSGGCNSTAEPPMLKKIIVVRNIGRFISSALPGVPVCAKYTQIFGANGYGKTTL